MKEKYRKKFRPSQTGNDSGQKQNIENFRNFGSGLCTATLNLPYFFPDRNRKQDLPSSFSLQKNPGIVTVRDGGTFFWAKFTLGKKNRFFFQNVSSKIC